MSAIDLEGHLGTDKRHYLCDFSRVFPPERPNPNIRASYIYRLFRPGFFPSPLFPGWASEWVAGGWPQKLIFLCKQESTPYSPFRTPLSPSPFLLPPSPSISSGPPPRVVCMVPLINRGHYQSNNFIQNFLEHLLPHSAAMHSHGSSSRLHKKRSTITRSASLHIIYWTQLSQPLPWC